MQFNRFIFDNYLATDEGKKALAFFKDFENVLKNKKKLAYFNFLNYIGILPIEKQQSDAELRHFSDVVKIVIGDGREIIEIQNAIEDLFQESGIQSIISDGKDFIENEIASHENITERDFMTFVRQYSIHLWLYAPQFFFPYYFKMQFPKLENICKEFNIVLPLLPPKRDYKKHCFYYIEVCKSFYDFRQ